MKEFKTSTQIHYDLMKSTADARGWAVAKAQIELLPNFYKKYPDSMKLRDRGELFKDDADSLLLINAANTMFNNGKSWEYVKNYIKNNRKKIVTEMSKRAKL